MVGCPAPCRRARLQPHCCPRPGLERAPRPRGCMPTDRDNFGTCTILPPVMRETLRLPVYRLSLLGGLAGGWSSLGRCGEHPPTLQPKAARRHRTRPPYEREAPAMTKPMPARRPQPAFPPSGGLPPDASLPGVALGLREPSRPPSGGGSPPARRRNGRQPQLRGRPTGKVGPPGAQGRWCGACVAPHQPRPCRGRGRPPRVQSHPATQGSKVVSTPMRRASASGTSMFMSRNKTFVATRAPPSRQILAAARSSGAPRGPRTPATGQAARWSPSSSKAPPQRQCLGMCGSGSLRRRNRTTRMHSEGMRSSGAVRSAVMARGPPGPAWDNRSAREAGSRSERRLSRAAASKHAVAALCHPRKGSPKFRAADVSGREVSTSCCHGGASKPAICKLDSAFRAAPRQGKRQPCCCCCDRTWANGPSTIPGCRCWRRGPMCRQARGLCGSQTEPAKM